MKIETIGIDQIKPYEKNAKLHPKEQIEQIKKSIEMYGNNDPIAVWGKNNTIVEGHGRYLALKEMGATECEIIRLDHLTNKQRREYMLVHNKLTMNTDFDFDILDEELGDLDFDGFDFGFEMDTEYLPEEIVEDEIPEPPAEPKAKLGDLYQLGDHRLICGDSTDVNVIDRLMDGAKADMSFTSPPYGVELGYNSYVDTFENTKRLVTDAIPVICAFTNEYVVLNWGDIVSAKDINKTAQPSQFAWLPIYDELMKESGWFIWAERIWKKVHARCSGIWSASSNRPVSDWEYIFTWAHKTPAYNERNSGSHFGVIDSAETAQADTLSKHPGAFPVYVAGKVIEIHTKHNQSVLDVFGGSGSTLIACEQLNRKCYMCELDPHYVDVIIERWENLTGQKAVLLNE